MRSNLRMREWDHKQQQDREKAGAKTKRADMRKQQASVKMAPFLNTIASGGGMVMGVWVSSGLIPQIRAANGIVQGPPPMLP